MESVHSSNVELVIKTVGSDSIVIQDAKEINEKGEELETTEYFLHVEGQTTEEENEDAQFVPVDDDCEESHEAQFVAMEVDDSDRIILHDKDVILWNRLCRICANDSDRLIPIFNGEGLEHNLCNKIHSYLPLTVSESDSLPIQVCYNCAATLLAWHEMSKGCLDAQQRLMDLQTKFNLKDQYYNDTAVEQENIQAILEVEASNSEESQAQSKCGNNVDAVQVTDVSDSDRSKSLQRGTFKEYQRSFKPTLPTKKSRKKTTGSSKPVKKKTNRTIRKKTVRKVGKVKIESETRCLASKLESENSECSSFTEVKLEGLMEVEVDDNELDELTPSPVDASKSKKSRRGRNSSGLECNECNKKFRLYNSYQIHMRIHTGEKPYTCHICGKQFGQTGSLYYHLKHVHGGVKNHACDICGRCFAMKTAMEDHRRIHTGERPYVCDSCGKTFKTKASLYIHSKIHTNEYPFKCSYCKKLFRWKQQMINHLTTHTGEKNHMCDICGKGFGVKNELTRHRRTHSLDKPFTCQKCGVSFGQKRYLTNHNRTRHKTKTTNN